MTIETTNDPDVLTWRERGMVITRARHPMLFLALIIAWYSRPPAASDGGER